jgi:serine/threonine protein kinase
VFWLNNWFQAGNGDIERKSNENKKLPIEQRSVIKNQGVMQIPNYEILETIGEGGFAIVYKARKEKDSLLLTIKVPRVPYKDFIKELAVRLHLNNHSISILSNMIYTRLTTKNRAYDFVELAYYVFQVLDD